MGNHTIKVEAEKEYETQAQENKVGRKTTSFADSLDRFHTKRLGILASILRLPCSRSHRSKQNREHRHSRYNLSAPSDDRISEDEHELILNIQPRYKTKSKMAVGQTLETKGPPLIASFLGREDGHSIHNFQGKRCTIQQTWTFFNYPRCAGLTPTA